MSQVNTIMSELLRLFPRYEFEKLENKYNGNHYTKYFNGWQQLIVLLFSQAGKKDSLRDIGTSLSVHHSNWYHIGLQGIKRSTLSDAMSKRSYMIYEGLFYKLLDKCKSVIPNSLLKCLLDSKYFTFLQTSNRKHSRLY